MRKEQNRNIRAMPVSESETTIALPTHTLTLSYVNCGQLHGVQACKRWSTQ